MNNVEKYEEALAKGKASFPAFIKPKDGSSSINAYKVENLDDLKLYAEKIEDYIIQPFISGREFTIDIFCDYEGNPVYITPRERLAVRSGEVLKTRITQDETMIDEMLKLIADYKPCGQITVQLIHDDKTEDNYYIEINPRFGGGAPLSIKAGADSAKAVLKMLSGEKLIYQEKAARDSAVYSRFDQSVCVNEG
jgi:carbamoyl-phosphate synthase large subunit